MSVDIPSEAYAAAEGELRGRAPEIAIARAVKAAAPHIRRAAQVAILNQLSDMLLEQRDKLTRVDLRAAGRRLGLEEAAAMARSLAATVRGKENGR